MYDAWRDMIITGDQQTEAFNAMHRSFVDLKSTVVEGLKAIRRETDDIYNKQVDVEDGVLEMKEALEEAAEKKKKKH